METKVYQTDQLHEAAEKLKKGELVAFPTETVYGLGANALLPEAVKQVFAVKGRPSDNPLIVTVADFTMVQDYVDNFHPLTKKIVENYWPGPLTLIFTIKKNSLPSVVTGGLSTAAFRMPANKKTRELIKLAGVPLVGPSANTSGKPSPTTSEHVYHDLKGKIAGIVDDGAASIGLESTVLDLSDSNKAPVILRPGAITQEDLSKLLGVTVALDGHLIRENEAPKAPGMKYKHYAPDTKVLLVKNNDWEKAKVWVKENHLRAGVLAGPTISEKMRYDTACVFMYSKDTAESAAKGLFAGLRALDNKALNLDVILAEIYPEEGIGAAYMNRLKKSASQHYFTPEN
ncbi:threonylcarbamoyl-AMP synthase [Enterococcus saigonensis]|uniref:Threonylcarbamoyl-AMP synthase n=1 Tax=Enterococcus saigonensis TaxID=1805431 RepID=A0A679I9A9_9ENTE|nr:L-threonylcarbamoyladenylate synthase [Enterococcus saigonensis]BCA84913.1 threonylcarbamoyl-AMP synthase [Enterococcus saigonensis]